MTTFNLYYRARGIQEDGEAYDNLNLIGTVEADTKRKAMAQVRKDHPGVTVRFSGVGYTHYLVEDDPESLIDPTTGVPRRR